MCKVDSATVLAQTAHYWLSVVGYPNFVGPLMRQYLMADRRQSRGVVVQVRLQGADRHRSTEKYTELVVNVLPLSSRSVERYQCDCLPAVSSLHVRVFQSFSTKTPLSALDCRMVGCMNARSESAQRPQNKPIFALFRSRGYIHA